MGCFYAVSKVGTLGGKDAVVASKDAGITHLRIYARPHPQARHHDRNIVNATAATGRAAYGKGLQSSWIGLLGPKAPKDTTAAIDVHVLDHYQALCYPVKYW